MCLVLTEGFLCGHHQLGVAPHAPGLWVRWAARCPELGEHGLWRWSGCVRLVWFSPEGTVRKICPYGFPAIGGNVGRARHRAGIREIVHCSLLPNAVLVIPGAQGVRQVSLPP